MSQVKKHKNEAHKAVLVTCKQKVLYHAPSDGFKWGLESEDGLSIYSANGGSDREVLMHELEPQASRTGEVTEMKMEVKKEA